MNLFNQQTLEIDGYRNFARRKYKIFLHGLYVYACKKKEKEREQLGILFYVRREIFRRW